MEISNLMKSLASFEGVTEVLKFRENVVRLTLNSEVSKTFFLEVKQNYGFEHCSLITAVDNQSDFEFANNRLRILSGLYGMLKPSDLILPYRLEMGTKLKNSKGKNLYEFWGEKITDILSEDILNKDDHVINLASNEYFKSIKVNSIESKVITPIFKEFKNGSYKTIAIYAKKARGLMSRYIIDNELENYKKLKNYNDDGYSFDSNLSNDLNYVFTR